MQKLFQKIKTKKANIGVIGLGYVGLPLALAFAKVGFPVTGFLRDPKKMQQLSLGDNYLNDHTIQKELKEVLKTDKFHVALMDKSTMQDMDILIVCVPTPVDEKYKPDLGPVISVATLLSRLTLEGKLIINESTVAPGTTREVFGNLTKDSYYVVCSPERIDPGNTTKTVRKIPKVVGGINEKSGQLATALYKTILEYPAVRVRDLETAEMVKMLENTSRAVNIGLINEFAKLSDTMGLDILEILDAAKTKWSFSAFYPGIGVGGHCIPVDPYYILEYAKSKGLSMPLVAHGLKDNEMMSSYVANKLFSYYKKGKSILVYGLTYKKDVKDVRESPVFRFCKYLKKENVPFSVYDPMLSKEEIELFGLKQGKKALVDIFVVGTDHSMLSKDCNAFIGQQTIVIDGRNFFRKKVGIKVIGVGRELS